MTIHVHVMHGFVCLFVFPLLDETICSYTVEWMDGEFGKHLEGTGRGLLEVLSQHSEGEIKKIPRKTSVRIAIALAKNRTEHFPNMISELYR
jgi:hypothetical protein